MKKSGFWIINSLTIYRLVAAPVLVLLVFMHQSDLFKWMLAASFFTDLIDGWLARKFKVESALGSKLDSVADDLNIVAALIGLFVFKTEFVFEVRYTFYILLLLFIIQTALALFRYHKISSFHTYCAKTAAILQGLFFVSIFFFTSPVYWLFYAAAIATAIDLVEEIILVCLIPKWVTNVKGLYWVLKRNQQTRNN